jgi:uncharacterized membrane protein YgdD (TMEM256/DUF423 family)
MAKFFLLAGTVMAFLSVALGAFGAHALKERLDTYLLGVFQTGVTYQFFHAVGLILVGLLSLRLDTSTVRWSGFLFLGGISFFSGSLYLLALTGVKAFGAITPIGGLAFLIGWALLGKAILNSSL